MNKIIHYELEQTKSSVKGLLQTEVLLFETFQNEFGTSLYYDDTFINFKKKLEDKRWSNSFH